MDNADRCALLAGTSGTSRAVGVALGVAWHSIVDDVSEVVNVQSACSHVGSHEQLCDVLAEFLHCYVALLLREVAVQRLGIVSVAYELVGYFLRFRLGTAEDYAVYARIEVDDALQGKILVLGVHHIIYVIDVLGTLVARSHYNLLVVVQIVEGNAFDVLAHSSREQECVAVGRHVVEYLVDRVGEAHVEHLVSLVEHHVSHLLHLRCATVHEVDETSRSSHYNLCPVLQGVNLVND